MSIGKKDISRNISSKIKTSSSLSSDILDIFIDLIKNNSRDKVVKFNKFGSFYRKNTPSRKGRNPKTCLLYTSPSPRDGLLSRMPSSA